MSAWYIFSALGFYPVCPGSDHYVMGSPLFRKASIHLENGKIFTIKTTGNSTENVYIQDATLNGTVYTRTYLRYEDIANGGLLEINMTDQPNTTRGNSDGDLPVTSID
jgi:putative alpha-1,2-mannosidase